MKLCYQIELAGFKIELKQFSSNLFSVRYGMQKKNNLTYAAAAQELGACIMHALACEGKIDNSALDN